MAAPRLTVREAKSAEPQHVQKQRRGVLAKSKELQHAPEMRKSCAAQMSAASRRTSVVLHVAFQRVVPQAPAARAVGLSAVRRRLRARNCKIKFMEKPHPCGFRSKRHI